MPESLGALLSWLVKPNTIIVGDFNFHYELWEPNVSRSSGVSSFVEWIDNYSLSSALPYGAPTHRADHGLDLVLMNMEGLSARVDPESHSTSDHETISGFVQLSSSRRHPTLKLPKFNNKTSEVFRLALSATAPPSLSFEDPNPQRLDAATSSGIAALSAILLAANPPRPACVPCKDYWNRDCSDQRRQYLEARHSGDQDLIREAYNNFWKSVRRAKREHKRSKLDNVSSILEAHKVVGWRKLSSRFGPPPIHFQGVTYSTPTERADIFFRTKLAREIGQPDTPRNTPTCPLRAIPAPLSVDEDEVRHCLLEVSSTTPGHDHLSVSALRLVWGVDTWRSWIVHLYRLCLEYGHHPSIFRRVEVVVIPKPHKDDLTNPANWRPISLLPVLGKGTERLFARRFASWALSNRIISPTHFGALPARSVMDLVECLVHDVEKAWETKQVCTLATLNIQIAFDSVQPGRLRSRVDFFTQEFSERIRELPPWDILVFSDGSKQKDGSAGAGAVVLHRDITAEVKVPLGPDFEVYDSEIIGALEGLRAAIAAPSTHLATNIHVILDNQEAAHRLLDSSPSKSSQMEILEFWDLASRWPTGRILPIASPGKVQVMWSPGHMGIPGNELADKLAGDAARQPAPPAASLAGVRAKIQRQIW
ncbi:hypothetical protein K3495_g4078 [Podosphaera aphanis]|nr:hypothetical protein K3495_g4078 [Podosphaera aphanis]